MLVGGSAFAPALHTAVIARSLIPVIAGVLAYVAAGDPHLELDGLPFEPRLALCAGGDGLDCIRHIVAAAPAFLKPGGWLLFEHGYNQGEASRNLLAAAGFKEAFTHPDLAGIARASGAHL